MIEKDLKDCIGRFMYLAMYSRGEAFDHWQRNIHLVKKAEFLYNYPHATKDHLISALQSLVDVAKAYISPKFRMDNEERIEAALKALGKARECNVKTSLS